MADLISVKVRDGSNRLREDELRRSVRDAVTDCRQIRVGLETRRAKSVRLQPAMKVDSLEELHHNEEMFIVPHRLDHLHDR